MNNLQYAEKLSAFISDIDKEIKFWDLKIKTCKWPLFLIRIVNFNFIGQQTTIREVNYYRTYKKLKVLKYCISSEKNIFKTFRTREYLENIPQHTHDHHSYMINAFETIKKESQKYRKDLSGYEKLFPKWEIPKTITTCGKVIFVNNLMYLCAGISFGLWFVESALTKTIAFVLMLSVFIIYIWRMSCIWDVKFKIKYKDVFDREDKIP